jgi:hypothetical protein
MRGGIHKLVAEHVLVPANASRVVSILTLSHLTSLHEQTHYLYGRLEIGGAFVAENRLFFVEPKHMEQNDAGLRVRVATEPDGTYCAVVRARRFAKAVTLSVTRDDAMFEDNYFDCDAGDVRRVRFRSALSLSAVRKRIRCTA